ncbi:MAG: amino acid adenylation domain-containing protein, partial [Planctomycetaceae bacterium]
CSSVNGQPELTIHEELRGEMQFHDLRSTPVEQRLDEAKRLIQLETRRPFDLATGPLLRLTMLKFSDNEHWLSLTTHHFVSDGLSTRLLFHEITENYSSIIRGEVKPPVAPRIQYVDYAAWQTRQLESGQWQPHLDYWKERLAGAPSVIELPVDRPRPPARSSRGAVQRFAFERSLVDRLNRLSRNEGVTLFMTLMAGFQALIHRYTRQNDIVVGTAVSNRSHAELESLLGAFTNNLAIRVDLSGDPTFRELLLAVRDAALGAYAHQDLPFVKLVEALAPKRDVGRLPLMQVLFVLHHHKLSELFEVEGVDIEPIYLDLGTSRFDMGLEMTHGEGSLEGSLEYNTDIFDAETIDRFIESLEKLLQGAVENPDKRVSEYLLISSDDAAELLSTWCKGPQPSRESKGLIPELFELQAARVPAAVAIVSDQRAMTYEELNARSNQLARMLRSLGVGPESRVALCLRRSPEMVVGLLAIWKAGGVYVPIDPDYPPARIEFMMLDTSVDVIITQSSEVESLPKTAARVVCIDADSSTIAREESTNLGLHHGESDAAYIIYTSGSTGVPKGVVVCHREISDYIQDACRLQGLMPSDCVLQFFSINFDPSLEQIFAPLISGARIALRGNDVWLPEEFGRRLREYGVTIAYFTPVVLLPVIRHWDENPNDGPGQQLRTVVVGGDFLSPDGLRRWKSSLCRNLRLVNAYGPTETTIAATACEAGNCIDHALSMGRLPIGRPLQGRTAYILDQHLNLVPPGVPGELYLGGDGTARGYLNRPEVTASRFVPDPFIGIDGARMYRTGDLARWMRDGQIEMLGRVDHQVKIRGFRVELGEIEAALLRQPAVAEAVVVVLGETVDEKRLIAYLVLSDGETQSISELRAAVGRELADYMVPSSFVVLDRFPITPNGKVDRAALPVPEAARPDWSEPYQAPRTPVEEILSVIWAEVLRIDRVGVHDNFFELGGHSLLATQVVSRLRETFEIDLPLRSLFERPTVEQLALSILELLATGASRESLDQALMELEK